MQVAPGNGTVLNGQTVQFQAYAFDNAFDGGPASAAWTVSGGGSISGAGLFSATAAGGPFTVTGTVGAVAGTTGVTVVNPPTVVATNVAPNQVVSASSVENGGTLASYAVDGNLNSRWSSASTDSESFTVDLGTSIALGQVVIKWEGAYGKQYTIQGSNDAAAWTPLASQTAGAGGTDTFNFSGTYRYIRMQGVQRGSPYGYSLWEFQVY